jgi:hypothetical protein
MYGFYPRGSYYGIPATTRLFTNGAGALAANDPVNLEAGVLTVISAGDFVAGVSMRANVASATKCPVDVTPFNVVLADNDNAVTTFVVGHVGARFDTTGTTGAVVVDTSSLDQTYGTPVGTLTCLEYNPQVKPYETDESIGLFLIAESQFGC